VVFTDKAARAAATSDGLDAHFGTSLPRTPDELVQLLAGLPA
jgi:hypothetical protein